MAKRAHTDQIRTIDFLDTAVNCFVKAPSTIADVDLEYESDSSSSVEGVSHHSHKVKYGNVTEASSDNIGEYPY